MCIFTTKEYKNMYKIHVTMYNNNNERKEIVYSD